MTEIMFDSLARHVTGDSTRRGVVTGLISALFGAASLALGGDPAAARHKHKHKRKKRKKKQRGAVPVPPPFLASPAPPPSPPSLPPCVGSCVGKVCGDDGCGVSCGTCSGAAFCENGQCLCAPEDQCGATCCDGPPTCFEDHCTCVGSRDPFCSCPANATVCANGVGCCLSQDTCIDPVACSDLEACACATQTCSAGNDVCHFEFAFCGSGAPGTCGCFTHASGSPLCAVMPPPDESVCPQFTECVADGDCDTGEVCADVRCCNLGVLPFVGRCVIPCP